MHRVLLILFFFMSGFIFSQNDSIQKIEIQKQDSIRAAKKAARKLAREKFREEQKAKARASFENRVNNGLHIERQPFRQTRNDEY